MSSGLLQNIQSRRALQFKQLHERLRKFSSHLSRNRSKSDSDSDDIPCCFRHTHGNWNNLTTFPLELMILLRMGKTCSTDRGGSGSRRGLRLSWTRLRSITSIVVDPLIGSRPVPVMLTQFVSLNRVTLLTASMRTRTFLMSSSVSLAL